MTSSDAPDPALVETAEFLRAGKSIQIGSTQVESVSSSANQQTAFCRRMSFTPGSGSALNLELESLLHSRLKIAAVLLLAASVLFLVRNLFWFDLSDRSVRQVFWPHLALCLFLTTSVVLLFRKVCWAPLRLHELNIFGAPAVFFCFIQFLHVRHCASLGYLDNPAPGWLLLVFIYAIYIPNTWQRAAVVVGAFSLAPVVLMAYLIRTDPVCARIASADGSVRSALALTMLIAFVTAVYGVYRIGNLRSEAYQAKRLGQYQLLRKLGSGGMGDVYLAEHSLLKRPCALKVIRPEKAGNQDVLNRFEREVQLTAQLSHWNSVDIYDYGRAEDGTFFYVMEYLPGMNLNDLVNRFGPLNAERTIYFLCQLCDALEEAHHIGLIHRDIKPANVFSAVRGGRRDVVKLLDFGLARPIRSDAVDDVTQDGVLIGSPLYMSPEQALQETELDARSDIYSLGALGFFLLTGEPPFPFSNPIKVLVAQANSQPPNVTSVRPDVPEDLALVIQKCLDKDKEKRFESVAALRRALVKCQQAGLWNSECALHWWERHSPNLSLATELVGREEFEI
ncbi:MAG: serine/threonine protein kinase [Planctomycetales bacterium]|nr:serine/threonine protein kinase [Planctomycetales bacterium]